MENTRDIRDYIIDTPDEMMEEIVVKKTAPKKRVSYKVLIQSGCDFVVERRENNNSKRLVVLVSQKQFYIESDSSIIKKLTHINLWEFLRDLPKDGIRLDEVSWLPVLLPKKIDFSNRLMDMLSDDSMVEFLQKEIAFVPMSYYTRCPETNSDIFHMNGIICNDGGYGNLPGLLSGKKSSPFFEIDTYGPGTPGVGPGHLPMPGMGQGIPPMNGQMAVNSFYVFKNPGSAYTPRIKQPEFTGGIFNDQNDDDDEGYNHSENYARRYIGMKSWEKVLYGTMVLYSRSPGLYKDMIRLVLRRYGCNVKNAFEERLLKRDSPENFMMRSFQSFILLRVVFGPEWGIRAMERFLDSSIRQVLPYEFLVHLMFKVKIRIPFSSEECYKDREMAWNFKADKFLQYLFVTSFDEGYGDDMEGFISRWENVLIYQKLLYGKVNEKYPENLATLEHKMAFDIRRNKDAVYQRMWAERAIESEKLEYEGDEYRIITAKSNQDLIEESFRQHNCVDGYEGNVLSGRCTILFMRFTDPKLQDKSVLTIEVTNEGVINQVKGSCNRAPRMKELNFVKEWADEKKLKLDEDEVMLMEW